MKRSTKKKLGIALIIFILIIAAWSLYSYLNEGLIYSLLSGNIEGIIAEIQSFGYWGWIIFFILIVIECVFAPFPPLIIYIAGGVVFGGFAAGTIALLANAIGAAIAYKLSKIYGRKWVVSHVPDEVMQKVEKYIEKYGSASIFLLRLNPLTSTDFISYAAGLTKMNFKKFLFWTTLALAPSIFLQTYLGQEITENPLIFKLAIIAAILYVLAFAIIYFFFMRNRRRKRRKLLDKKII